jgi:hypothetical protein
MALLSLPSRFHLEMEKDHFADEFRRAREENRREKEARNSTKKVNSRAPLFF